MGYTLTDEDKKEMREHGCFILRGAVEEPLMESVEDQLWSGLDVDRNSPKEWIGKSEIRLERSEEAFKGPMLQLSQHENIYGIVEQFVGKDTLNTPDGVDVLLKYPTPGTNWAVPPQGHLDGFVGHRVDSFNIGVTIYGHDVKHKDGAFTYWPGSPKKVYEYFQNHPFCAPDGSDPYSTTEGLGASLGPGTEFIAEAGDAVFWHSYMVHCGSGNTGKHVRFGMLMRFTRHDARETYDERPDDMWKYWDIA